MSTRLAALIAVAASAAAVDPAAGAPRQRYTPASSAIAPVAMAASCRPEAAADVDLGAAWLLVREAGQARAAFDRAVDQDPDCALGYWGQALAQFPAAERDGRGAVIAAEAAIGRALAVAAQTPFERAVVAALRALRDRVAAPGVPAAWPSRVAAYRDALCAGAPSDRRIRLWCARALADAATSMPAPDALPAALPAALPPVPEALPHIVELARERALDVGEAVIVLEVAADAQAPIVASALAAIATADPPASWPHERAAGMAIRRGDWAAAAASSARAGAAAADTLARARAFDAELEALMQLGRRREAYARAGEAMRLPPDALPDDGVAVARIFALMVLADRRIDGRGLGERAALPLGERTAAFWPVVFVAGLDAALRAWPGPDATLVARARQAVTLLEAQTSADTLTEVDWAITIVKAAIAASQDEHQEMALLLTHAAQLERDPSMVRWSRPLLPTAEIAAELWLRTYRYDDARRDARAALDAHPRRISPNVVLARTAARLQDQTAATEAWRRVLELRATADADDTIRLEAQRALAPAQ